MSPFEAVKSWLEKQTPDARIEIAFCASYYILNNNYVVTLSGEKRLSYLQMWLNDSIGLPTNYVVGRALHLRAVFDYAIESGFMATGTKEVTVNHHGNANAPEKTWTFASDEVPSDFLAQKQRWSAISASWNELVLRHLTNKALRDWVEASTPAEPQAAAG